MDTDQNARGLETMKVASEAVRSALSAAIHVPSMHVITLCIPGTVINYQEFAWNVAENNKPPLSVQVVEAKLVDGMIPLSKFTSGQGNKSVARSYLAALDALVPAESSISKPPEIIGKRALGSRYQSAMKFLNSTDDTPNGEGRSRLQSYVKYQTEHAQEVARFSTAQDDFRKAFKSQQITGGDYRQKEKDAYLIWMQQYGRHYQERIKQRYMDWVVHGHKTEFDFSMDLNDGGSGMQRIEESKEAFRSHTLIVDDGASEYVSVVLSPPQWATTIREKVVNWQKRNLEPSASEVRAELVGLKDSKASYELAYEMATDDVESRTSIQSTIAEINREIKALEKMLTSTEPGLTITAPSNITVGETKPWTRISCKVSANPVKRTAESSELPRAVLGVEYGPWGVVFETAIRDPNSSNAMSEMSSLEVEIKMDCMVVEIERPWLHAQLFADAELDSGNSNNSPGEDVLKQMYEGGQAPDGNSQQFSSYPTAMIVAADIELNFSGDTTALESATSASQTDARIFVGCGPFQLSASHKQSRDQYKTKTESTATGCRISVQAPQIIGWIQTLVPRLPKSRDV